MRSQLDCMLEKTDQKSWGKTCYSLRFGSPVRTVTEGVQVKAVLSFSELSACAAIPFSQE